MAARVSTPAAYKAAYALWMLLMFEPQWYLVTKTGVGSFGKASLVLAGIVAAFLLFAYGKVRVILVPFLVLLVFVLITCRLAPNPTYATVIAKQMIVYSVVAIGMSTFVRTPRQAGALVAAYMSIQFLWWGLWGVKNGAVSWHPQWANYDGFGPLMALGIVGAFHYGLAIKNRKQRLLAYGTALMCVLGLVSTYARGAFLGMVAVMGWMWLISPRKGKTTLFVVAAAVGVLLGAAIFRGALVQGRGESTNFFDEMFSVVDEYQTSSKTTGDREILWGAAVEVWKHHPVLGAGPANFGAAAAEIFSEGDLGGDYVNPLRLYDRKLHNIYYEWLSEWGLLGCGLWLWLLVDFYRRNKRMRSAPFIAYWNATGGGFLDLRWVSLGLSAMMIAILTNGMFYNLLQVGLLPTLIIMNGVVFEIARPRVAAPVPVGTPGVRRGPRALAART